MGGEGDETAVLEALHRRQTLLQRLASEPARPPALADDLESARSTVERGLSELEAVDLIERVDGQYRTTLAGELALAEFDRLVDRVADVAGAWPLLGSLPADAAIDPRFLDGASLVLADRDDDDSALDGAARVADDAIDPVAALEGVLETASHHRIYVPSFDHRIARTYVEAIRTGTSVEVTLPSDAVESVLATVRRETADAIASGRLALYETTMELPYALVVVEFEDGAVAEVPFDRDRDTDALAMLVVCENGSPGGVITNDDAAALEWATRKLASVRATAQELTLDRSR
ncbi:helix-turn-helix transcriptional regulator [Halosolutus halophilus]|uniref:helix-turn-helix transcriptional regulator n=1 Tax=Halosolutus halophilus TaxID=1552990 RepID=UPI0022351103|nr:hypothetical protein [Halosolutus halophilus]